jgi:flagellar biosynthesis repressor protein FlbT
MKKAMNLSLRANEKIYINGAILKFDRKVTFEILNDATFLLETHVIQPEQTTTPLRQLYFVIQTMLVDPRDAETARLLFEPMLISTAASFEDPIVLRGLRHVDMLVADDRFFEALKQLRGLFPAETKILASSGQAPESRFSELPLDEAIPPMPFASAPVASLVA